MARERTSGAGPPQPQGPPPGQTPPASQPAGAGTPAQLIAAQIAVTQALTQQIGALNGLLPQALGRLSQTQTAGRTASPSRGGLTAGVGGQVGQLAAGISAPITAAMAPLALLAQTLGQTSSGMSTFLSMTRLITAQLSGLVLPTFLGLTGMVYAASKELEKFRGAITELADDRLKTMGEVAGVLGENIGGANAVLEPFNTNLGELAAFLNNPMLATLKEFDLGLKDVNLTIFGLFNKLKEIGNALGGDFTMGAPDGDAIGKTADELMGGVKDAFWWVGENTLLSGTGRGRPKSDPIAPGATSGAVVPPADTQGELPRVVPPTASIGPAAPNAPKGDSFKDSYEKGLDLALKGMERELSPQANLTSLTQGFKGVLLAGLNADPIKQEELKLMRELVELMRELKNKWRPPTTT